jgi:DMSO/TMAO reductase YedYZ molybdopterin-dependent catalytic subunit
MTPNVSRGFRGRRADAPRDRVPPGQYATRDFPVLSAGPTPHTPLEQWDFSIVGEVDEPRRWTWEEFRALPSEEVTVDIHCVTKWSKLDTVWQGVSVDTLLDGLETAAEYVVQFCDGGYTTNLPLADVTGGKAWVAFRYDGEPLEPEHGGPARMLVPHLYFWKSAKWLRGLRLTTADEPGFWEITATTTTAIHGASSGTGATDLAGRRRPRRRARDAPRQDDRLRRARLARTPGGPARRHPPHRRGRLPGAAQLLDRIDARRHPRRSHRRAPRRRRGLPVPDRRASAGRPDRTAWSRRRLLRLGAGAGRAAAARRRRLGGRAADGDDPRARRCRQQRRDAAQSCHRAAGRTSSTATSSSATAATGSQSSTR